MPTSFLTREGYDNLQNELEFLRTKKREEIAQRLHEAMEGGELIENAEYEAAKNEQAFVEGRIKELELLLATARIIDEKALHGTVVQVGSSVTIAEEGSTEEAVYHCRRRGSEPLQGPHLQRIPPGEGVDQQEGRRQGPGGCAAGRVCCPDYQGGLTRGSANNPARITSLGGVFFLG